ncbi:MAG: hypothetical protein ABJN26_25375 [Stappiaceae bacterium]
MAEKLKRWATGTDIPDSMFLHSLLDDTDGLHLVFVRSDEQKTIKISFDTYLSFRNADEGDRLKFLNEVEGLEKWPLYIVENSEFLKWFHEQTYNIHQAVDIKHYAFITPDDIVEILARDAPVIES